MGYFKFTIPQAEQTIDAKGRTIPIDYDGLATTPSDSTVIPVTRGIAVTGAGNVSVNLLGGGTAVLTSLSAGQVLPIAVVGINATGTTATGVFALY